MPTKKQILANQKNAKRSTGPRTPAGKKTSARNALKTGVYADSILLDDENERALGELKRQLYVEYAPVGPTEIFQVERLAKLHWSSARLCKAEKGLISMHRIGQTGSGGIATALDHDNRENGVIAKVMALDAQLENSIIKTIRFLAELQESRGARSGMAIFLAKTIPAIDVPVAPP